MPYFICTNIATCERLDDSFATVDQALDFAAKYTDVEHEEIAIIDEGGQSVINRERIAERARALGRKLPPQLPSIGEEYEKK